MIDYRIKEIIKNINNPVPLSRREGFNFTGSLEIKNIPNTVKHTKEMIMEKEETFIPILAPNLTKVRN